MITSTTILYHSLVDLGSWTRQSNDVTTLLHYSLVDLGSDCSIDPRHYPSLSQVGDIGPDSPKQFTIMLFQHKLVESWIKQPKR